MATGMRVFAAVWLISTIVHTQSGFGGKWSSEGQPGGGPVVVLQLSVKGSSATGTVTIGESPTQALSDGKVDGKSLTFKTATMLNGKEVPVLWEGTVAGSQLTLLRSFGSSGRKLPAIVLQRSK